MILFTNNIYGITHHVTSETDGTSFGQFQWCIDNSIDGDTIEFMVDEVWITEAKYLTVNNATSGANNYRQLVYKGNNVILHCKLISTRSIVQFYNITFEGNIDGAISMSNSDTWSIICKFINCKFINYATLSTSILNAHGCRIYVINCIIYETTSSAIFTSLGAGSCIINCTIVNNYGNSVFRYCYGSVFVINSIIFGNNMLIVDDYSSTPIFKYSLLDTYVEEETNLLDIPQFVGTSGHEYELQSTSPCINAGNNTYNTQSVDLAGNVRIQNNIIDIGCYEYSSASSPLYIYPGDANNDGICSIMDYFLVASANGKNGYWRNQQGALWQPYIRSNNWNTSSYFQGNVINNSWLDCNGDGIINLFDVAVTILNRNNTHD